ncbi:MAG: homocysteine S-methyltransferase family protein [Clostridiales bacterium]|nr:homocysteine S-methyltransferase family protein [Clostridiales bacterium]
MNVWETINQRIVFFDGGMGSLLQEAGLRPGELPGTWNLLHPETVVRIHRDYLEAGADVVTTNTFGVDGLKYKEDGEFALTKVIRAAVHNAREAIRLSGKDAVVALDMSPTGKLLKPLGDLAFEDAYALYRRIVEIGADAGADLILIETMSDSYEAKAAVLAAKEACSLPVVITLTFDEKGKLLTGGTPASAVAMLEGLGVDAIGVNCGLGPLQMKEIVKDMLEASSLPLIVNPNAGLPRSENGKTVYDINADEFAVAMRDIVELGARAVGGCCGTTPEHIRKTVEMCSGMTPRPVIKKHRTVVTSFCRAVEIGGDPVIIGERINPTGKKRFKQALRDHDLDYILKEGIVQADHGAHILDVNVGLPEIDEPQMLEEVVKELQSIQELPLQIDTSDPAAMERALRIYNGKAMINSVNGKEESMREIFPLVKKYGGVVVALALDENGIPADADGRIAVAEKIYRTAAEYGISPDDIVIDGLCMTISSDSQGAVTTLETLRRVRDELHGKTILGVSNISFGLPQREIINAAFFTMAMQSGLNAAIINPNSEAMMRAYYTHRALMGLDANCTQYIDLYGGWTESVTRNPGKGQPLPQSGGVSGAAGGSRMTPGQCIEKGLKEEAVSTAREQLRSMDALDVINTEIIPALDRVGKGFEAGTVFLPQLLMSAEAAKGAFEVIREKMQASGQKQASKGKIILATVKGDIHDIGKNIVRVLLENYGYDVIDLGKDVPPETIVAETIRQKVSLVGLSALMTTTVPSMEETIRQLRRDAPWAKVMVGGAVLTQEYADTMGADSYCKDAMASVNFAGKVLG